MMFPPEFTTPATEQLEQLALTTGSSPPKKQSKNGLSRREKRMQKEALASSTSQHLGLPLCDAGDAVASEAVMASQEMDEPPPSLSQDVQLMQPVQLSPQALSGDLYYRLSDLHALAVYTPAPMPVEMPPAQAALTDQLMIAETTMRQQADHISTLQAELEAAKMEKAKSTSLHLEAINDYTSSAVNQASTLALFEKSALEEEKAAKISEYKCKKLTFECEQFKSDKTLYDMELERANKYADHHEILEMNQANQVAVLKSHVAKLQSQLSTSRGVVTTGDGL